jgi:dephospho-CoA kinase
VVPAGTAGGTPDGQAGVSLEEAQRRINAQMPVEEKRRRADYQIDCSGSMEQTRQQADAIYRDLLRIVDEG